MELVELLALFEVRGGARNYERLRNTYLRQADMSLANYRDSKPQGMSFDNYLIKLVRTRVNGEDAIIVTPDI